MTSDSLAIFVTRVQAQWGPLSTELVQACRNQLAQLSLTDQTELWLESLLDDRPASRELHCEPTHGFMLLAHAECKGLFRPPHDHGRGWVVYAVQSGELEVRTYARLAAPDGCDFLVQRETHVLRPGEARAYLPGDIHDTRCLSEKALLFRFTERDLRQEDRVEHRVTRFVEQNGRWVAPRK